MLEKYNFLPFVSNEYYQISARNDNQECPTSFTFILEDTRFVSDGRYPLENMGDADGIKNTLRKKRDHWLDSAEEWRTKYADMDGATQFAEYDEKEAERYDVLLHKFEDELIRISNQYDKYFKPYKPFVKSGRYEVVAVDNGNDLPQVFSFGWHKNISRGDKTLSKDLYIPNCDGNHSYANDLSKLLIQQIDDEFYSFEQTGGRFGELETTKALIELLRRFHEKLSELESEKNG